MKRVAATVASLVVVITALGPTPSSAVTDAPRPVVLILLENHSFGPEDFGILGDTTKFIVGNADAPYINDVLLPHATLFTRYFANSHPSLPNYIQMTSGTNAGCLNEATCHPDTVGATNLFDLLGTARVPFASYAEDMPSNCYAADTATYPVDHNPEVYYTDLDAAAGVPYGCAVTSEPLPDPLPDQLPAFTYIEPNKCDSMHGSTPTSTCPKQTDQLISKGDAWLSRMAPLLLRRGADLFVVFDEATGGDKTNGGGHVFAAEIGPGVGEGAQDGTTYSHYSLLAALERRLGVVPLLGGAATATPLPDAGGAIPLPPTVDALAPTTAQPGDTITVTGTRLGSADSVTVGGSSAAFAVLDDGTLSVVVPAAAVSGPVSVTTWGGATVSSQDLLLDAAAASISSVEPPHGVVGTDVTISGAGLAAATAVSFGSGAANFTVVDDSHLSAVVPYDATSGPVVVTTPTAEIPAPEPFTVDPPVALVQHTIAHGGSALSPSSTWLAPATGGDLLTAVFEWSGSGTPVAPPGWSLASKRNGVAIFEGRPAAPPVTVTIGGTALGAWILDITEWSGVTAAMPVDRTAFATSGAIAQTIASSGTTPTTSAAGELALGAIKSLRSVALTSPSNGFSTLDMAHQGSITLGVFYRVAGAPAPESVSVTLSAAAKWRGSIATFRRN